MLENEKVNSCILERSLGFSVAIRTSKQNAEIVGPREAFWNVAMDLPEALLKHGLCWLDGDFVTAIRDS